MARGQRNTEVALNFDGLTDATTNLVGALILLVLLLLGVTHEHIETVTQAPPPPPPPAIEESLEGPKTLDELRRQAAILRASITQTDQEIIKLEQKMPDLRARAAALLSGDDSDP